MRIVTLGTGTAVPGGAELSVRLRDQGFAVELTESPGGGAGNNALYFVTIYLEHKDLIDAVLGVSGIVGMVTTTAVAVAKGTRNAMRVLSDRRARRRADAGPGPRSLFEGPPDAAMPQGPFVPRTTHWGAQIDTWVEVYDPDLRLLRATRIRGDEDAAVDDITYKRRQLLGEVPHRPLPELADSQLIRVPLQGEVIFLMRQRVARNQDGPVEHLETGEKGSLWGLVASTLRDDEEQSCTAANDALTHSRGMAQIMLLRTPWAHRDAAGTLHELRNFGVVLYLPPDYKRPKLQPDKDDAHDRDPRLRAYLQSGTARPPRGPRPKR
jgi:hypothetical protein